MKKAKITISILAVMVAFVAFGAQKSEAAFSLSLGFGGGSIGFNSGYGYDDYGYGDYGYDDYGYDDYGYDDYGYDSYDDYGYDYDYMQPAYSGYGGGNRYYTNNYYGNNPCNCGGGNSDYYSGSIAPTYGYYGGQQSSQYTRYPQQYGYGYGNQDLRMCYMYGC